MAAPSTILVTGANGFVGHHTLPVLRRRFPQARLIGAVRQPDGACAQADATIAVELADPDSLEFAIRTLRPMQCCIWQRRPRCPQPSRTRGQAGWPISSAR